MMKIATFNIQNLFHRDKSFVNRSVGRCVKNWLNEMDDLLRKSPKITADQERIRELSFLLGFEKINKEPYAFLRRRGGALYFPKLSSFREIKAEGFSNWNGWTQLQTIPVDPISIENKARLIAEMDADILLLQEVEDRFSLREFNLQCLPEFDFVPYPKMLVIQGNDGRGQETGLLTRGGYGIDNVRSYVNELDPGGAPIFNKNFLRYEITSASGEKIWLLAAHLQEQKKDKNFSDGIRYH